jgi:MarR family 2-MHQ and catechol resistance regulon transcriptional repressor
MGTKYNGNDREKLVLNAFIKLKRATSSISQELSQGLNKENLSETQFGILEVIFHLGPVSQKELSKKLLCSPGNLSQVLDNMEKSNLIKKSREERDKRFYSIELTEEGYNKIKNLFPKHLGSIMRIFSILEDKELFQACDILKKIGLNQKS